MPRNKTISDEALLDAALEIVRESGPDALTFQAVAPRVGLASSTVVQRFGTKPALLRAALSRAWDRLEVDTATADAEAPVKPTGVIDLLVQLSAQYDPEDFADQLLILREDLRDPVLRARGQAWLATLTRAIERRLEPVSGEVAGLGELFVTYWQGSLTIWSFKRHAPLKAAVHTGLEQLLARLGFAVER
jgi:AcrR family transcriptional regulator